MRPRADRPVPDWARWNPAAAERPWTVGVEEEVMLLDPGDWGISNRVDEVLAAVPPHLAPRTSADVHACVVELKTAPAGTVAEVAAELADLRRMLADVLGDRLRLGAAAAGTHPIATGSDVAVSSGARYREIERTMGALARREPTMALHVHVAMPDGEAAVRALDGLRHDLPLLLALSANSPFWRGGDSGFASARTPIFSMFPRVGIPRRFGTYATYVRVVGSLLRSGAIPEPTFLWWDARLQPRLGTIEVRIMDAQTRVGDVAGLAAAVRCAVRRSAEVTRPDRTPGPEVLAENRFLAARDGMEAMLIDADRVRRPAREALAGLLDECRPVARELGCASELAAAAALAADPGYAQQRRLAQREGLRALPRRLADVFTATVCDTLAA